MAYVIARRCLYECEPAVTTELLQILVKDNACSPDKVKELLKSPRKKQHLSSQEWHPARLGLTIDGKPKTKPVPASTELMRRFNREKLYEKVWAEPTPVGEKIMMYQMSDWQKFANA